MMNNTEAKMKSNDGLPEVAEKLAEKRSILIVTLGLIALVVLGLHFYSKSKSEVEKQSEEVYSIPTASETESKPSTLPVHAEQAAKVDEPKQEITAEQIELIQQKQKELQQRLSAPLMVVSNTSSAKSSDSEANQKMGQPDSDPNRRFMNQVSVQNTEVVNATTIGSLNTIIAQGSQIHATMDSATITDLPGSLRASVSEPVYSEDGSQVLVPIGSRLTGEYKSGMVQGQQRVFIVWSRLLTPAGISVNLGSLGTDNLGVAGVGADEIDRHFWQRFGTASLLSILGSGTANLGVTGTDQQNSAASYREAVANSFNQSASQSLQQDAVIAPTLKTYQGKPIIVFVTKDLHFESAMHQVKPKINVF